MSRTEAEAQALALDLLSQIVESEKTQKLQAHFQVVAGEQGAWEGPYPWQVKFHNAGGEFSERGIIAANQTGKTRTCAIEVACHLTGLYPPWWEGHRFKKENDWIACGNTNEDVRNIQQKALLGTMEEGMRIPSGTGWIPKHLLGLCGFRQCGIPNVVDTVKVKHVSGGWSTLMFKSYEQGAVKFQGLELNGAWMDEEPPLHLDDIFSEVRTRLITRAGHLLFSRTPLFGMSAIIQHFINGGPGIWWIAATWGDAPHLSAELQERYSQTYLEHEVDARTKGIPMLGEGGVYRVPDEQISCKPFEIPEHFRRICGIDFGINHPFAAVWIAYDADNDITYVTDAEKISGETPGHHAEMIKSRGSWIPVSWPHDGLNRDKGGGAVLKDQYIACGVNMLPMSARHSDETGGGMKREAVTSEILGKMRSGRFKVFSHLSEWFEEKRMLHRITKNGQSKIVDRHDDMESATRYACMMLRFAVSDVEADESRYRTTAGTDLDYDPLSEYSHSGIM
jgi:phage terminase large subunit-like protein